MDISADLIELGRTPVCVVSSGVKSILDVGRTLELLETQGVCVIGFKTDEFPAFFSRRSGFPVPTRIDTEKEAAAVIKAMMDVKLGSGILIGVPIPQEDEATGEEIELAIVKALQEINASGIQGRDVTPFVLSRVNQLTEGKSLKANVQLVKNNVQTAAKISYEYWRLTNVPGADGVHSSRAKQMDSSATNSSSDQVVVIGGSNVDVVCRLGVKKSTAITTNSNTENTKSNVSDLQPATYSGSIVHSCGGGGRNVAETLARLGARPHLLTCVADDLGSAFLRSGCAQLDWSRARVLPQGSGNRTATYMAVLSESGELRFGIGDMDIHEEISASYVKQQLDAIQTLGLDRCHLICFDGNLSVDAMVALVEFSHKTGTSLWYEPTDLFKATKVITALGMCTSRAKDQRFIIDYVSPNLSEFWQLLNVMKYDDRNDYQSVITKDPQAFCPVLISIVRHKLQSQIRHWIIKMGSAGVLYAGPVEAIWISAPTLSEQDIASVSGAGDSLVGAVIYLKFVRGCDWKTCLVGGVLAAAASLMTHTTGPDRVNPAHFTNDQLQQSTKHFKVVRF